MTTTKNTTLTPAMEKALHVLRVTGVVFAGQNVSRSGRMTRIPASVLYALQRRGFAKIQTSPDGGIMAREVVKPTAMIFSSEVE